MTVIIWADVTAFVPGLEALDPAAQEDILADTNTTLNIALFGGESSNKLRLARIYLAAHRGTLAKLGESGSPKTGPVASESAGGLSRSYASAFSMSGSSLDLTTHGQAFRELVRMLPAARMPLTAT